MYYFAGRFASSDAGAGQQRALADCTKRATGKPRSGVTNQREGGISAAPLLDMVLFRDLAIVAIRLGREGDQLGDATGKSSLMESTFSPFSRVF